MVDAGLVVITAFISPFTNERNMVRKLFEVDEFVEVFVETPLEVAEARTQKAYIKKPEEAKLKFHGIDSPYEKPTNPEVISIQ